MGRIFRPLRVRSLPTWQFTLTIGVQMSVSGLFGAKMGRDTGPVTSSHYGPETCTFSRNGMSHLSCIGPSQNLLILWPPRQQLFLGRKLACRKRGKWSTRECACAVWGRETAIGRQRDGGERRKVDFGMRSTEAMLWRTNEGVISLKFLTKVCKIFLFVGNVIEREVV